MRLELRRHHQEQLGGHERVVERVMGLLRRHAEPGRRRRERPVEPFAAPSFQVVQLGDQRDDVDRPAPPPGPAPSEDAGQERSLHLGHPRDQEATIERLPELGADGIEVAGWAIDEAAKRPMIRSRSDSSTPLSWGSVSQTPPSVSQSSTSVITSWATSMRRRVR